MTERMKIWGNSLAVWSSFVEWLVSRICWWRSSAADFRCCGSIVMPRWELFSETENGVILATEMLDLNEMFEYCTCCSWSAWVSMVQLVAAAGIRGIWWVAARSRQGRDRCCRLDRYMTAVDGVVLPGMGLGLKGGSCEAAEQEHRSYPPAPRKMMP